MAYGILVREAERLWIHVTPALGIQTIAIAEAPAATSAKPQFLIQMSAPVGSLPKTFALAELRQKTSVRPTFAARILDDEFDRGEHLAFAHSCIKWSAIVLTTNSRLYRFAFGFLLHSIASFTVAGDTTKTAPNELQLEAMQREVERLSPDHYDVAATVHEPRQLSEKYFETLSAARSEKEFEIALRGASVGLAATPAANAVVTLQGTTADGQALSREAVADVNGSVKFSLIPRGDYRLSARKASRSFTGADRMAFTQQRLRLDGDREAKLELDTNLVTISGRILDVTGKPVSGAKVTAVENLGPAAGDAEAATYTVSSGPDGYYEITGAGPVRMINVLPYLVKGQGRLQTVTIRAQAAGMSQADSDGKLVPLLSEEQVALGRRVLEAYNQMRQHAGQPELREKQGLVFPTSKGNIITGVDIVLQPAAETTR